MVVHPDPVQVEVALFDQLLKRFQLDGSRFDLGVAQKHLSAHAAFVGFRCLDLLPAFRASGSHGGLYRFRDAHYSRKGHELAAEQILRFLQNEGLLPRGARRAG